MAGGERERELQRQLAQAALQAEAALESQAAALASDNEATVQRLVQQRDTANAALNVSPVQRGLPWMHVNVGCTQLGDWVGAHRAVHPSAA